MTPDDVERWARKVLPKYMRDTDSGREAILKLAALAYAAGQAAEREECARLLEESPDLTIDGAPDAIRERSKDGCTP